VVLKNLGKKEIAVEGNLSQPQEKKRKVLIDYKERID